MLHPERLDQPLRWRKPRMVFVNSMSDLFHEQVPDDFIAEVYAVIAHAPQHTFQLLTKRPERMRDLLAGDDFPYMMARAWDRIEVRAAIAPDLRFAWPLVNCWAGVSIENRRFVRRADLLRQVPAAVRFISAEPLLGALISHTDCEHRARCVGDPDCDDCMCEAEGGDRTILGAEPWSLDLTGIDWLIAGGESGPGHRPMRVEWMRDLHDACRMSGTAWFAKQDSGPRAGQRGRIPDDLWVHEWPAGQA